MNEIKKLGIEELKELKEDVGRQLRKVKEERKLPSETGDEIALSEDKAKEIEIALMSKLYEIEETISLRYSHYKPNREAYPPRVSGAKAEQAKALGRDGIDGDVLS